MPLLKMQKVVPILLCCDVDPDREAFSAARGSGKGALAWDGLVRGVPRLLDGITKLEAEREIAVHFNWFFRSDTQMERIYGEYAWSYKAWPDILARIAKRDDEIAWHPHLWRLDDDGMSWFQEMEDLEYMDTCLRNGFKAIPEDYRPSVVRTGWDFHNAFTMQCLSDLGIAADLSALPGIASEGSLDPKTRRRIVVRDWIGSPDRPYFPSKMDPRKEAKSQTERLDILEIPVSTFTLPAAMRLVKRARDRIKGRQSGSKFSEPYITKTPALFKAALDYYFRRRDAVRIPLVVEFHADELLPDSGAYSMPNVIRNLEQAVDSCSRIGLTARFERASVVAGRLRRVMEE